MALERSVALVVLHDFFLIRGGAERLAALLARGLDADLTTGFLTADLADWPLLSQNRLLVLGPPKQGRLSRYLAVAHRFETMVPTQLDRRVVIYSGVLAPLAVRRQAAGRRIHYCHSPPRFLYDLRGYYARQAGWPGRLVLAALDAWLRPRYERAVRAMDLVVANSENVRRRLARYLGVEAVVVHPPVETERFRWRADGDYYLSTARLEDFKRVDVVIEAFRRMPGRRLVVASGGSQEARLRQLAAGCSNISFTSWLTEAEMAEQVGRCRAVVYVPLEEDFGMSPVEAMAAGKPVIGVAEGGLLETVVDGETGVLVPPLLDPDGLIAAVERLDALDPCALRHACEARAAQFSCEVFLQRMRAIVDME